MYLIRITPRIMVAHDRKMCGRQQRSCQCQVAQAFKEATGDEWGVGWSYATRLKDKIHVELPLDVASKIRAMDNYRGHDVQPFDFQVDIQDEKLPEAP